MGLRVEKVRAEWEAVKEAYLLSRAKLIVSQPSTWSHFYVDVYVETLRAAPYTLGHVAAFVAPLAVLKGIF